jgi:glycine/D-amino acid oxidase-like deaminating enzyme
VGVGYFGEDEGSVDPKTAVAALLRDATSRGLRRLWPCIATDLVFQDGLAVGVETSEGTLPCDEVVFACGVETPTLARRVGLTVPLVRSSGALIELEPVRRFLQPVVRSPTFHAIQRPDGRVVLSKHHDGTPIPSDGKLDPSELLDAAAEVLPQLKNAVVERLVVGHRVLPSDGLPIVARSSEYPNVRFVAFNAGITLAPLIAELLTTEIASGVSVAPLEPYRVTRFVNGNGHPRPRS